jgi:RNA polymerase sigma-70 factor, ECF subfamily
LGDDLRGFIESRAGDLKQILRHYVLRMGIADYDDAETAAAELLDEVTLEALQHADRAAAMSDPTAWLLGIAANLIKRRMAENARLNHREPLLRDLYPDEAASDDELIDRFVHLVAQGSDDMETSQQLETIFQHASPADEAILRLAVLHELDGDQIAAAIGTSPGAARVRLHRALKRLRQFWGSRDRIDQHE